MATCDERRILELKILPDSSPGSTFVRLKRLELAISTVYKNLKVECFLSISPLQSARIIVYNLIRRIFSDNNNHRRYTMKVSQAVDFHLQYHRANPK